MFLAGEAEAAIAKLKATERDYKEVVDQLEHVYIRRNKQRELLTGECKDVVLKLSDKLSLIKNVKESYLKEKAELLSFSSAVKGYKETQEKFKAVEHKLKSEFEDITAEFLDNESQFRMEVIPTVLIGGTSIAIASYLASAVDSAIDGSSGRDSDSDSWGSSGGAWIAGLAVAAIGALVYSGVKRRSNNEDIIDSAHDITASIQERIDALKTKTFDLVKEVELNDEQIDRLLNYSRFTIKYIEKFGITKNILGDIKIITETIKDMSCYMEKYFEHISHNEEEEVAALAAFRKHKLEEFEKFGQYRLQPYPLTEVLDDEKPIVVKIGKLLLLEEANGGLSWEEQIQKRALYGKLEEIKNARPKENLPTFFGADLSDDYEMHKRIMRLIQKK